MKNLEKVTAIGAARKASGLYQQECADAMHISLPTYRNIELEDEEKLTLGNLKSILPYMNNISRKIMRDRVDEIFLSCE